MRRVAALAVLAAATLAGCGGGSSHDRFAGPQERITLRMESLYSPGLTPAAVQYFVHRVDVESHGALRVELVYHPQTSALEEPAVVRGVAAGRFDLAWVGTRVFDLVGVSELDALSPPFPPDTAGGLVAAMRAGAADGLLPELRRTGVTGLAILAAQGRRLLTRRPIRRLKDLRGLRIRTAPNHLADAVLRALGAQPVHLSPDALSAAVQNGTIDGMEQELDLAVPNGYATKLRHGLADVAVWAEPVAVIANPARIDGLGRSQRTALLAAARDATDWSMAHPPGERGDLATLCAQGLRLDTLGPSQRARLAAAVKGLAEARVSSAAGRLALKSSAAVAATSLPISTACSPGTPPAGAPASAPEPGAPIALPEGIYRSRATVAALVHDGVPLADAQQNSGVFTMTLRAGRFSLHQRPEVPVYGPTDIYGRYRVRGGRVIFDFERPTVDVSHWEAECRRLGKDTYRCRTVVGPPDAGPSNPDQSVFGGSLVRRIG